MKKTFLYLMCLSFAFSTLAQKDYTINNKSSLRHVVFNKNSNDNYISSIPDFKITDFNFIEEYNDGILEADEKASLRFNIRNSGEGKASDVVLITSIKNPTYQGLEIEKHKLLGDIYSGHEKNVSIIISGNPDLIKGLAEIQIDIQYRNGVHAKTIELELPTKEFEAPNIIVADAKFSLDKRGHVEAEKPIYSQFLIQNVGQGIGSNIRVEILLPDSKSKGLIKKSIFFISQLSKGESIEIKYPLSINKEFISADLKVNVMVSEKYNLYSEDYYANISLIIPLPAIDEIELIPLELPGNKSEVGATTDEILIEKNIPLNILKSTNRIALIIGNENYQDSKLRSKENYSKQNATLFKEYAVKTLGLKEDNIFFLLDATSDQIETSVKLTSNILRRMKDGELIFYYSGEGITDIKDGSSYFLPCNANSSDFSVALNLNDVMNKLSFGSSNRIIAFIETGFSRSLDFDNNNYELSKNENSLPPNLILYAAAKQGNHIYAYPEIHYGLFTYYLLKKINDSKGLITYSDLGDYIKKTISLESLLKIKKDQDPTIFIGKEAEKWFKTKTLIQY